MSSLARAKEQVAQRFGNSEVARRAAEQTLSMREARMRAGQTTDVDTMFQFERKKAPKTSWEMEQEKAGRAVAASRPTGPQGRDLSASDSDDWGRPAAPGARTSVSSGRAPGARPAAGVTAGPSKSGGSAQAAAPRPSYHIPGLTDSDEDTPPPKGAAGRGAGAAAASAPAPAAAHGERGAPVPPRPAGSGRAPAGSTDSEEDAPPPKGAGGKDAATASAPAPAPARGERVAPVPPGPAGSGRAPAGLTDSDKDTPPPKGAGGKGAAAAPAPAPARGERGAPVPLSATCSGRAPAGLTDSEEDTPPPKGAGGKDASAGAAPAPALGERGAPVPPGPAGSGRAPVGLTDSEEDTPPPKGVGGRGAAAGAAPAPAQAPAPARGERGAPVPPSATRSGRAPAGLTDSDEDTPPPKGAGGKGTGAAAAPAPAPARGERGAPVALRPAGSGRAPVGLTDSEEDTPPPKGTAHGVPARARPPAAQAHVRGDSAGTSASDASLRGTQAAGVARTGASSDDDASGSDSDRPAPPERHGRATVGEPARGSGPAPRAATGGGPRGAVRAPSVETGSDSDDDAPGHSTVSQSSAAGTRAAPGPAAAREGAAGGVPGRLDPRTGAGRPGVGLSGSGNEAPLAAGSKPTAGVAPAGEPKADGRGAAAGGEAPRASTVGTAPVYGVAPAGGREGYHIPGLSDSEDDAPESRQSERQGTDGGAAGSREVPAAAAGQTKAPPTAGVGGPGQVSGRGEYHIPGLSDSEDEPGGPSHGGNGGSGKGARGADAPVGGKGGKVSEAWASNQLVKEVPQGAASSAVASQARADKAGAAQGPTGRDRAGEAVVPGATQERSGEKAKESAAGPAAGGAPRAEAADSMGKVARAPTDAKGDVDGAATGGGEGGAQGVAGGAQGVAAKAQDAAGGAQARADARVGSAATATAGRAVSPGAHAGTPEPATSGVDLSVSEDVTPSPQEAPEHVRKQVGPAQGGAARAPAVAEGAPQGRGVAREAPRTSLSGARRSSRRESRQGSPSAGSPADSLSYSSDAVRGPARDAPGARVPSAQGPAGRVRARDEPAPLAAPTVAGALPARGHKAASAGGAHRRDEQAVGPVPRAGPDARSAAPATAAEGHRGERGGERDDARRPVQGAAAPEEAGRGDGRRERGGGEQETGGGDGRRERGSGPRADPVRGQGRADSDKQDLVGLGRMEGRQAHAPDGHAPVADRHAPAADRHAPATERNARVGQARAVAPSMQLDSHGARPRTPADESEYSDFGDVAGSRFYDVAKEAMRAHEEPDAYADHLAGQRDNYGDHLTGQKSIASVARRGTREVQALAPVQMSFDALHPALADDHFLHTRHQREMLMHERARAELEQQAEEKRQRRMRDREFAKRVHNAPELGESRRAGKRSSTAAARVPRREGLTGAGAARVTLQRVATTDKHATATGWRALMDSVARRAETAIQAAQAATDASMPYTAGAVPQSLSFRPSSASVAALRSPAKPTTGPAPLPATLRPVRPATTPHVAKSRMDSVSHHASGYHPDPALADYHSAGRVAPQRRAGHADPAAIQSAVDEARRRLRENEYGVPDADAHAHGPYGSPPRGYGHSDGRHRDHAEGHHHPPASRSRSPSPPTRVSGGRDPAGRRGYPSVDAGGGDRSPRYPNVDVASDPRYPDVHLAEGDEAKAKRGAWTPPRSQRGRDEGVGGPERDGRERSSPQQQGARARGSWENASWDAPVAARSPSPGRTGPGAAPAAAWAGPRPAPASPTSLAQGGAPGGRGAVGRSLPQPPHGRVTWGSPPPARSASVEERGPDPPHTEGRPHAHRRGRGPRGSPFDATVHEIDAVALGMAEGLEKAVRRSRELGRTALTEEELAIATGRFDERRRQEHLSQLAFEMQRRFEEGGYDSDLEREGRKRGKGTPEDEERMKVMAMMEEEARAMEGLERAWQAQDEWMDEYRRNIGHDHVVPTTWHRRAVSARASAHEEDHGGAEEARIGDALDEVIDLLSPEEREAVLQGRFVPHYSEHVPKIDIDHSGAGPNSRLRLVRGSTASLEPPPPTVPRPFSFDSRAKGKPLSTIKMELDLELRRQEEEAARAYCFRANPLPQSTVEPRYEAILAEEEARREEAVERGKAWLQAIQQPFSFAERDKWRKRQREEWARRARDPNRFQRPFRAAPVPLSVKEERFESMMADMERRKAKLRERAIELLEEAQMPQRMQRASDRSRRRRQSRPASAPHQRARPAEFRATPVPDFRRLHGEFERQLAEVKAANPFRSTVPEEFHLADCRCHRCRDLREGHGPAPSARKARKEAHASMVFARRDARWPYPRVKDVDAMVALYREDRHQFLEVVAAAQRPPAKEGTARGSPGRASPRRSARGGATPHLPRGFAFLSDPSAVLDLLRKDERCFQDIAALCPSILRDPTVFNRVRTQDPAWLRQVAPRDKKVLQMLRAFEEGEGKGPKGTRADMKRRHAVKQRLRQGAYDDAGQREERRLERMREERVQSRAFYLDMMAKMRREDKVYGQMRPVEEGGMRPKEPGTAQHMGARAGQSKKSARGDVQGAVLGLGDLGAFQYVEGMQPRKFGTRGVVVRTMEEAWAFKQPEECRYPGRRNPPGPDVGCARCGWTARGTPCADPTHVEDPGYRGPSRRVCLKVEEEKVRAGRDNVWVHAQGVLVQRKDGEGEEDFVDRVVDIQRKECRGAPGGRTEPFGCHFCHWSRHGAPCDVPALTEDARRRGNAVEGAGIERVCVKEVAPAERWLGPQQAYVVDRKWTLRQPPGCAGPPGTTEERPWGCAGCGWADKGQPCAHPTHDVAGGASRRVCVKYRPEPQMVHERGVKVPDEESARAIRQLKGCEGPAGTQERRVWGCARCGWSAQGVPCEVPTHHEMRRGAADAERERDALPSERVCVKLG